MSCNIEKLNLKVDDCANWPLLPTMMFKGPAKFVIPKATAEGSVAGLKTFIQDAMLDVEADRIYRFPDFDNFENASEENVRVTRQNGRTLKVRNGLARFNLSWSINTCIHNALPTHEGRTGSVMLVDSAKKGWLCKNTDGDYQFLELSLFDTGSLKFNDGANPSESPAFLELLDPTQLQNIYAVDMSFLYELEVLSDATITLVSATTTLIKVIVTNTCDGEPISGLLTADFIVKTTAGATQVVTAAPTSGVSGGYSLTGTSLATGTIELRTPDLLTVKAYEADQIVLTVPYP